MDSVYVALKSIKENGWLNIEYVSLLIALIAVFLGPIISYFTAKRTMKSQADLIKEQITSQIIIAERDIKSKVLSNNRQEWINKLRDNLSEFMSLILVVRKTQQLNSSELISYYNKLFTTRFRIKLSLNPNENDHCELDALLKAAMEKTTSYSELYEDIGDKILELSQSILKREWERVKKLE